MINLLQDFLNWTGSNNVSGNQYGFFSGFGSDISEFFLLGGIVALYRKHNCHVKGCPRIGKHHVDGTPYTVCKKHHPGLPREAITYNHVYLAHRLHNKKGEK